MVTRLLVHPSVRLSAIISAAPIGRIYVKFGTGDLHKNLSIKTKSG